uniref:Uncharacterized protein n=1 Tax=Octopus bimaculoides TaxID=37653 RepID=A0A0L8HQU2_OCTBM
MHAVIIVCFVISLLFLLFFSHQETENLNIKVWLSCKQRIVRCQACLLFQ